MLVLQASGSEPRTWSSGSASFHSTSRLVVEPVEALLSRPDLVQTPGSARRPGSAVSHFIDRRPSPTLRGPRASNLREQAEQASPSSVTVQRRRPEEGSPPRSHTKRTSSGSLSPSPTTRPLFAVATGQAHVASPGQGLLTLRRGPAWGCMMTAAQRPLQLPLFRLCPPSAQRAGRDVETQGKGPRAGNRVPRGEPLGARRGRIT